MWLKPASLFAKINASTSSWVKFDRLGILIGGMFLSTLAASSVLCLLLGL